MDEQVISMTYHALRVEAVVEPLPSLRLDVILCPVNAFPAMLHGVAENDLRAFSYTMTYNFTGWPGAVVRGGTSPEGLPIGVQIVAQPWREDVVLAVAHYLEMALGGWQRSPL